MKKIKNTLIKTGAKYAVVNNIFPPHWSIIELCKEGHYLHVQVWNTKKAATQTVIDNGGILSEYTNPEDLAAPTPSPLPETEVKKFIVHIEWEDGRKETRKLFASGKKEALAMARKMIVNPSINYGFSYWAEEIKGDGATITQKEKDMFEKEIAEMEKALFDEPTGTPPTPGNEREDIEKLFTPGEWELYGSVVAVNRGDDDVCEVFNTRDRKLICNSKAMYRALKDLYNFTLNKEKTGLYLDNILNDCETILNSITGGK